ncbi:GGDEF domain-containing protein [Alginatibacterium sediminis]|uniref:diguanylate cyclase n=1 Tax=Alginatibacterium sediminis TaxID=2164068 RepID=A0A420E641_9ALTE|nr:GGDEF domain-containing protein [Alginatibacterium sediminis]RKF13319.1 GGDEF domain-containing protein [Alginatibacterium sediminis]
MAQDDFKKSAANLKKAVPLMMKHQIPTTPKNYALWYSYVEGNRPKLNQAIETLESSNSVISPSIQEGLFESHISEPLSVDHETTRINLEAMVQELSSSMLDTNTDTTQFQNKINENFAKLDRIESDPMPIEQVMALVRDFVSQAHQIQQSTSFFSDNLQQAQKEIAQLKQKLETTTVDALHDSLTGILNRRAFDKDLNNYYQIGHDKLCMILIDIDHFKAFNDEYGHLLGDQVLKAVARRLNDSVREQVRLYRFGGEEFAILVPNSTLRSARHLAESMRRAVEKLSLRDRRKNRNIDNITASFGVAAFDHKTKSPKDLIAEADKQLYEAKNLGRNRVMPIVS